MADRFSTKERIGVHKVEGVFLKEFKWIPRTLFQTDVGIDMEVEVVFKGEPLGKLIAIQIKSGESYFSEASSNTVIYRGSNTHLNYWLNYSLPVIIVLHNPVTETTIWEEVCPENISRTKNAWKIEIPIKKTLDVSNIELLESLSKESKFTQKFQKLLVYKRIMEKLFNKKELILEIEEWVNKSDGRALIEISEVINGKDLKISSTKYINFNDVAISLQIVFPWSNFEIDEDFYENYDNEEFYANCGIWDSEEKQYIGTDMSFEEYSRDFSTIRPYANSSGEVEHYRLKMSLNKLGVSFLEIANFIENGQQLKLI